MKLIRWSLLVGCLAVKLPAGGPVPKFTDAGYAVPQPHHAFSFPRDHGSHPDFKIEWWYLTGHLQDDAGRRCGYQATFFRHALRPSHDQVDDGARGGEAFGDDHLFLAHMAFTDIDNGRFYHEQRLNRNGWQAWANLDQLDLANGNWSLTAHRKALRLDYTIEDSIAVSLRLEPEKPLLVFGEDGTSRKGADPAARSYYLTWSRLATDGTVRIGDERRAVSGSSWMDHEIASQQLSTDLAGWDWIAVQFDDGWELKAYVLRRPDGTPDPFSALFWIDPAGKIAGRRAAEFSWERTRWWTSPTTGTRYPVSVDITTTDPQTNRRVDLRVRPLLDAQELTSANDGIEYWEGACRVTADTGPGSAPNRQGEAYLELVGYAAPVAGPLR